MKFDNKIDLNILRLYVNIVESASLSAAADRMGMTRSNLSHRLKALELALDAQLLRRSPRSMRMTEAGQLLYHHASRILDEIEAAKTSINSLGNTVRGTIRIRLPTGLGSMYVSPLLLKFSQEYPQIALRCVLNDHLGDLVSEEIDVALKITSLPPIDYVARKVCGITWCLSATPEYLEKFPNVITLDALQQADWITPASMGSRVNLKMHQGGQVSTLRFTPRIQSGDYPFMIQAVLSGLGIVVLPRYAVWPHLRDKRLVEVLPEYTPEGVGDSIYIITPSNRFPKAATKLLIEYIERDLQQHALQWSQVL